MHLKFPKNNNNNNNAFKLFLSINYLKKHNSILVKIHFKFANI